MAIGQPRIWGGFALAIKGPRPDVESLLLTVTARTCHTASRKHKGQKEISFSIQKKCKCWPGTQMTPTVEKDFYKPKAVKELRKIAC